MYNFNKGRLNEFKEGRTLKYLADISGYSRTYLTLIVNGKYNCDYVTAKKIVEKVCESSIILSQKLIDNGLEYMIEYFFIKIN